MLTDEQILDIRMLLDIQFGTNDLNPNKFANEAFEKVIDSLTEAQEAKVAEILTRYAKVQYSTGRLSGEFSDDPARTRALLRDAMCRVIGFNPAIFDDGFEPYSLGRG